MTRTLRTAARAAAGALTLAVVLGAGSAAAAPLASNASDHARTSHANRVENAQRQVLLRIAVLDGRLLRAGSDSRAAKLDDAVKQQVLDNISGDRETLSLLAAGVMENPEGNLAVVRETVQSVRVANYRLVVNQLAHASRLSAKVLEAETAVAGDPSAPLADLDAAALALETAVAKALGVTAFSSKADIREVRHSLNAAHTSLAVVQDYRATVEEAPVEG
jgi:hypothetical protein